MAAGTEWWSPAAVGRGRSRRSRLGEVVQEFAGGRESDHLLLLLASLLRAPRWRDANAVEDALRRRRLMMFKPSPTAGASRQRGGGAPGAQVDGRRHGGEWGR
jgi:hypothetical protein